MRDAASRSRSAQHGLSLVELLVAMALGLVLIGGMISVFAGSRRSGELNTAIATMQEGARYALDALARDIRSSGFQGCLGVQSGATVVRSSPNPPTTNFLASAATASVVGADDLWSPAPPNGFTAADHEAVPGTHAVALQFGDQDVRLLRTQMGAAGSPSPSAPVPLEEALDGAAVGDIAIVSNCERADMFTITAFSTDGRDLSHAPASNGGSGSLSIAYGDARTLKQSAVMLFRSNVYYVGSTGQTNEAGDALRALYRQTLPYHASNPPTELVRGVENLRVSFGIRQSGDNLRYVSPDSTEYEPKRVEAVQIGLLMVSRGRVGDRDDDRTYRLAGHSIPPASASADPAALAGSTHGADRRYRLAFNTTVKIRNRRFR